MVLQNINKITKENIYFRDVIFTGPNSQLVLMSLLPDQDIGEEVHKKVDQILFFVEGEGKAVLNGVTHNFSENSVVYVTAGTIHNIINTGKGDLKLFTVYSPPNHPELTVHKTKEDAQKAESMEGGE